MNVQSPPALASGFGDFLVYVDESGDHELGKIDPQYPVFVLLFCILPKDQYIQSVCPDLQRFKFEFWGHVEVVLHEHDIRKPNGEFLFLFQRPLREHFLAGLSAQMSALPATVVAVVLDKNAFVAQYRDPVGVYDYAMETGLERVFREMQSRGQSNRTIPVIVEHRGRKEDAALELAFRKVRDGENALQRPLPFKLVMTSKASNSAGLQLTDLMARPVGLRHLRPTQPNRAYEFIEKKMRRSPSGKIEGWGLKLLP